MRFKLLGYTIEITKITTAEFDSGDPFTWSKKDQRIALKKASRATSAFPGGLPKIARMKAVRNYAKSRWSAAPRLLACKYFIEARFKNNGNGDLK